MVTLCPKCHDALLGVRYDVIDLDFCSRCRGIWLDSGELEALLHHEGSQAGKDPFAYLQKKAGTGVIKKYPCPRCDQFLEEVEVSREGARLTLERCIHDHGLWFDRNEIQQLLAMYPPELHASQAILMLNDLFPAFKKGLQN